MRTGASVVLLSVLLLCAAGWLDAQQKKAGAPSQRFQLLSPSFIEGQSIPARHTCDGSDVSPPLQWTSPPAGCASLALVADDPDAPGGTWVHWVIFNIPGTASGLPENVAKAGQLPDGSRQGRNDFQRLGYGGPCPPEGPAHRYFFKLYALSQQLELPPGATKSDLLKAMAGKVQASAQLVGRYQRKF